MFSFFRKYSVVLADSECVFQYNKTRAYICKASRRVQLEMSKLTFVLKQLS